MKDSGYFACKNEIMAARLSTPHKYEAFTEFFDVDRLDAIRDEYGADLYRECYADALEAVKTENIEIRSHFSGWQSVDREQAARFVSCLLRSMTAIPALDRPVYIEAHRLRGCTVADLLPSPMAGETRPGDFVAVPGGWALVTNVYRLTTEQANENALLYLDRWEGVDFNQQRTGGTLQNSATLPTTKNWKL